MSSAHRNRRNPPTEDGRLLARPRAEAGANVLAPGLHRLGSDARRSPALYIPSGYWAERPAPFVLSLHGAGGNAHGGLYPLHGLADEAGLIILSPGSDGRTWDVILGGYGPDAAAIDTALHETFQRCNLDPDRLAIAGFSDGASYALSLGITNGDLFKSILAFSPGFAAPAAQRGDPRIFVSHGTGDQVLPIGVTSRRVVRTLSRSGYDVTYREFDGPHAVPPEIAREALAWLLADPAPSSPATSAAPP